MREAERLLYAANSVERLQLPESTDTSGIEIAVFGRDHLHYNEALRGDDALRNLPNYHRLVRAIAQICDPGFRDGLSCGQLHIRLGNEVGLIDSNEVAPGDPELFVPLVIFNPEDNSERKCALTIPAIRMAEIMPELSTRTLTMWDNMSSVRGLLEQIGLGGFFGRRS